MSEAVQIDMLAERLAAAVADRVRPAVPIDAALWNSSDVANYLRVSKNQLARYTPRPDFPKPIRLPTQTGGHGHPLWRALEVIKWTENYHDAVIKVRIKNG